MSRLAMEVRSVDAEARRLTGVCVPYDEVSYLTPQVGGERVLRGAFGKSIRERVDRGVFLFREHDHVHPVGRATGFTDDDAGLVGEFHLRESQMAQDAMQDVSEGYLTGLSVGFRPVQTRRGVDGAAEVVEAALLEVSLVTIPAYDGARVLALRNARQRVSEYDVLDVDLSPIAPAWLYGSR